MPFSGKDFNSTMIGWVTIKSIKFCHLESDSALKASAVRIHFAESFGARAGKSGRAARRGRKGGLLPGSRDTVLRAHRPGKSRPPSPPANPHFMNSGTGQTKLVRFLKGEEPMERENQFRVRKI